MAPYLGNFYGVKARLVWVSATKKRKKKICVEENELTFFCIMIRLQSLGFLFGWALVCLSFRHFFCVLGLFLTWMFFWILCIRKLSKYLQIFHDFPWIPMIPQDPRIPKDSTGFPWIPLNSPGFPWIPLDSPGFPWIPLDSQEFPRIPEVKKIMLCYGQSESKGQVFSPNQKYFGKK